MRYKDKTLYKKIKGYFANLEGKSFNTAKAQVFFLQNMKPINRSHCYRMLMRTDKIEDRNVYPYSLGKHPGFTPRIL